MTQDTTTVAADTITERVRERYAQAAQRVQAGGSGCCASMGADDAITRDLYDAAETEGLPEEAVLASLGCGNPTALADLREGETVLDLGSGGGIDVLLSYVVDEKEGADALSYDERNLRQALDTLASPLEHSRSSTTGTTFWRR